MWPFSKKQKQKTGPVVNDNRFAAAYIFQSDATGDEAIEKAVRSLDEFRARYPDCLIVEDTEIRPCEDGIVIGITYVTDDRDDPTGLGRKFSDIAHEMGL